MKNNEPNELNTPKVIYGPEDQVSITSDSVDSPDLVKLRVEYVVDGVVHVQELELFDMACICSLADPTNPNKRAENSRTLWAGKLSINHLLEYAETFFLNIAESDLVDAEDIPRLYEQFMKSIANKLVAVHFNKMIGGR